MAWDGSGGFSRSNGAGQSGGSTWQNARDAGHNITPSQHDAHDQELADGIVACITKDGQSKPTADFRPNGDLALSLGSSVLRWLYAWVKEVKIKPGSFTATLAANGITANRQIELPDVDGVLAIAGEQAFPSGTRLVFQQTAAPSGWVKQTGSQYDNASLRMTTGTVATGGVDTFTTVFGASKSTSAHTLTLAQIPPHTHSGGFTPQIPHVNGTIPPYGGANVETGSAGSGQGHSHTMTNLNLKYADAIVAAKS